MFWPKTQMLSAPCHFQVDSHSFYNIILLISIFQMNFRATWCNSSWRRTQNWATLFRGWKRSFRWIDWSFHSPHLYLVLFRRRSSGDWYFVGWASAQPNAYLWSRSLRANWRRVRWLLALELFAHGIPNKCPSFSTFSINGTSSSLLNQPTHGRPTTSGWNDWWWRRTSRRYSLCYHAILFLTSTSVLGGHLLLFQITD
jgi:hypothetical protein